MELIMPLIQYLVGAALMLLVGAIGYWLGFDAGAANEINRMREARRAHVTRVE
jgi:hypothetical protein